MRGPAGSCLPVAERLCVAGRDAIYGCAIRLHESQRAVVENLDANAAFVHGAMMEAAERHEIRGFRFAAVGPVLDVMCIEVTRVRAAGKAAALVARIEDAPQRRGNRARLAPHVERLAVIVFDQATTLASQASRRAVSAAIEGPCSNSQHPAVRSRNVSAATCTTI